MKFLQVLSLLTTSCPQSKESEKVVYITQVSKKGALPTEAI